MPGLAKTLLISTLADVLDLTFNRIQFTPDLMPSDITGTDILEEDATTGRRAFRFVQGPVFANIVLADEINRTPPKTQAALLQSMAENKVTVGGRTYPLDQPYLVFATQNPIEQEGTYPLPEAQLDRFMFMIDVGYPSAAEEVAIVKATTGGVRQELRKVISPATILELQGLVLRAPAADHVVQGAVDLVRKTRPQEPGTPDFVKEFVQWGAGPRASQALVIAAKARAMLHGRPAPSLDDIKALARPVLRHRIVTNFHAEREGVTSVTIIDKLLASVGVSVREVIEGDALQWLDSVGVVADASFVTSRPEVSELQKKAAWIVEAWFIDTAARLHRDDGTVRSRDVRQEGVRLPFRRGRPVANSSRPSRLSGVRPLRAGCRVFRRAVRPGHPAVTNS